MEQILQLLLKENRDLYFKITDLQKEVDQFKQERPYQSTETKDLVAALAKARLEFKSLSKNKNVAYSGRKYEYSDLGSVIDSVADALAKYGVIISQQTQDAQGATTLHTKLMHSSGQWLEARIRLNPAGKTIQEWGSAMTYARRYTLMALCGIAPDDEDDDGMLASKKEEERVMKGELPLVRTVSRPDDYIVITPEQLEQIEDELNDSAFNIDREQIVKRICSKYNDLDSIANLPKSAFSIVFNHILEMKNTRKGLIKK